MEDKNIITGKKVARVSIIFSITLIIVVLIYSFVFDFGKDSRVILLILLTLNSIIFLSSNKK